MANEQKALVENTTQVDHKFSRHSYRTAGIDTNP